MKLYLATITDVSTIMSLINDAQEFLASSGIDQWQNGYPSKELILNDISDNNSYLIKDDSDNIVASTMFTTDPESSYNNILGNWITPKDSKYGVIHRLVVSGKFKNKGVAKFAFSQCECLLKLNKITSMRIDTHEDNIAMQNLLKSLGYTYCGIIILDDGDRREAYEKIIL